MSQTPVRTFLRLGALLAALTIVGPAFAVDEVEKPTGPDLSVVRMEIDSEHWAAAVALLTPIVTANPDNADANNLMGYATRKSGDHAAALPFYLKALEIDPKHLGANEYLGELYVETGESEKANERLKVLEETCGLTCEQYLDLKAAIDAKV